MVSANGSTICIASLTGYYIIAGAQGVLPCSDYCFSCINSSNNCLLCLPTYTMVSPSVCACDNSAGYFYDSKTGGCSLC